MQLVEKSTTTWDGGRRISVVLLVSVGLMMDDARSIRTIVSHELDLETQDEEQMARQKQDHSAAKPNVAESTCEHLN
jgi:hypothetical protein